MKQQIQNHLLIIFLMLNLSLNAQEYRMPLYPGAVPDSKNTGGIEKTEVSDITLISNVQIPDIAVYLPSKRFATGQAVDHLPGWRILGACI